MINWGYAAIMALALATGFALLRLNQRQLPMPATQRWGIGLGAFVGAMVGSKFPFLFSDWQQLLNGSIWFSNGKTILTGLAGGYLGVEIAKWCLHIKVRTGDTFVVPVAAAVAIGRLGCFYAGCCYGQPTDLPWGVVFDSVDSQPRHPTQLYEAMFHLSCVGFFLWCAHKNWFTGQRIKLYLILYASFRFVTEWLRPEATIYGGLTGYQMSSLCLIALFGWLWWRDREPAIICLDDTPLVD